MKIQKKIKQLVKLSLTSGKLDGVKIAFIAKTLSKKELGLYVHVLLKNRQKEKIEVTTAIDVPKNIQSKIEALFVNKDVFFLKDPSIVAGISVVLSDFIFQANIQSYLTEMKKQYE